MSKPQILRDEILDDAGRDRYERELLRAREVAERAAQARANFIAALSHEIRNPLNAIMAAGYLLDGTELTPEQRQIVKLLRSSSASLLRLINNVLDFSKIESGKEVLEEQCFDLPGLARDTIASMHPQALAKGLDLESSIDERIPPVLRGDPIRISQVLVNLLGNAIEFTQQGAVTLSLQVQSLTAESVSVEFRVTDTGIGIAPDRLPYIFDDFTQADREISVKHGGSDLGLVISRKLVEMQGGRLTVDSEPGRGSAFSFTLRLSIAADEI